MVENTEGCCVFLRIVIRIFLILTHAVVFVFLQLAATCCLGGAVLLCCIEANEAASVGVRAAGAEPPRLLQVVLHSCIESGCPLWGM